MAWRGWPEANGAPCDFVLGQADLTGLDHNRGAYFPTASALNMPFGLCVRDERLILAETANSPLLGFLDGLHMDASTSRLAGRRDFRQKGDIRWAPAVRDSLFWPYGLAACGPMSAIADSGDRRVLHWDASQ